MPKKTSLTELPKPPAPPTNWQRIAKSGKVWKFYPGEGNDFVGQPERFVTKAKAEAKAQGVKLETVIVDEGGDRVVAILASLKEKDQSEPDATPEEPVPSF